MTESREAVLRARVLRASAIRAIEAAAHERRPTESLMQRAGRAVASLAITMTAERSGPILVVAGPGNNGGDALAAATVLRRSGIEVEVARLDEEADYTGDARIAWDDWHDAGGATVDLVDAIDHATLVVDGLFGLGFNRAPTGRARAWIEAINASHVPVLAIDVPSGVDADTGHVADLAVDADRTLTFIARKPGLHTGDGLDRCGDVVVDLLGLDRDDDALRDPPLPHGTVGALSRPSLFAHALKPRRRNSHKGSFGSVAVTGGHDGMVGAALMAARTALHGGAGRVYVRLMARDAPAFDVLQPELMLRSSLDGVDAAAHAIGPGLGDDADALAALDQGLATESALVLDADALNAIAKHPSLATKLSQRKRNGLPLAVLTPHPLEAARLLDIDAKAVQADRIAAATRLAERTGSIVILKGAGSIVAEPSGAWVINDTGNPALATGGTGDVLCGLVAALLAQGMAPLAAARCATWVHGRAADDLVAAGIGPIGVAATELIPAIRAVLNRLVTA